MYCHLIFAWAGDGLLQSTAKLLALDETGIVMLGDTLDLGHVRTTTATGRSRKRGLKKVATANPNEVPYLDTVWKAAHFQCNTVIEDAELLSCVALSCGRIVVGRKDGTLSVR
jgi:hypothetical protein